MNNRSLAATLALAVLAAAPILPALAGQAFAQNAKAKKKHHKPAPSASASASASGTGTGTGTETEAAPPAPTATETATPTPSATETAAVPPPPSAGEGAPASEEDPSYTKEEPGRTYMFVGLRYRGTLIPQFLENMFVDDGSTVFTNAIGAELDIRKDDHSMVLNITYADYGFGETLFHEKGKPLFHGLPENSATGNLPNNYSDVSSSLKAIYLGLDELWSAPLDKEYHWQLEYGFGVGLGIVFGTLYNDWVYAPSNGSGPLSDSAGNHYAQCPGGSDTAGNQNYDASCDKAQHQNPSVAKVGHYAEPNWFNGGSVPVLFPNVWLPVLGVRYQPVKAFEARLNLGFSLTGFWFGLSGDYGLPENKEPGAGRGRGPVQRDWETASGTPSLHGML